MNSRTGQVLTRFDKFRALSQISFFNNDPKFKTIYGGILSLLIYSLGLAYFLYLMAMWWTYQIYPKVTT